MKHPPQEPDLVPGRRIGLVVAGVVVTTAVGVWIAYGIGTATSRGADASWMSGAPAPMPAEVNGTETRPFVVEAQGLVQHQQDDAYLASYGWVDRDRRIVHVPLEVAYRLYLAQRTGGAP